MCGIAGSVTLGSDRPVEEALIKRMITALHHRGPDDHGLFCNADVGMANARLSIIDIAGGHQPMSSHDGKIRIVYNGELYNMHELRSELQGKGHKFDTQSDTEVILRLYEAEGASFVRRLNGMFSVCIYDANRREVLIARDRFGVKPLFYMPTSNGLAFASELKALKVHPEFDSALDPEGLSAYLGLFYIPDPWTIYRKVKKLRPGHMLRITRDGVRDEEYFDVDLLNKSGISREDAVSECGRLLEQAVTRQLLADVPVGVLLSGGLDSRSVLAAASKSKEVKSFTVTFDEGLFDEGGDAQYWAASFNSEYHPMLFREQDFCDNYVKRQHDLDEPYAPWCNVATAMLARDIAQTGHKVVLSGEGGDELFLGYPTLHAANVARYYSKMPRSIRRMLKRGSQSLPAGGGRLPLTFMAKSFLQSDDPNLFRMFYGFKEVVRFEEWPGLLTSSAMALVGDIDPYIAFRQYESKVEDMDFIDALSYFDFKVFLPGSSFAGNDNAYMSESVESRVPFMDNDLVDFAMGLPLSYKFHPYKMKPVLRAALQNRFPPTHDQGPKPKYKKIGFEIPGNEWLREGRAFDRLISNILSPARLAEVDFFQPDKVQQLLAEQRSGKANHERLLQAITSLTLFLDGGYDI